MNAIVRAGDIAGSLEEIQRISRILAVTSYFAAKGDSPLAVAQIATQILAGREMGFGPFASVQGIHIINGKPALSANLMASAVKNSPRYDYRVREISDKVCRVEFFEFANGKRESLGVSEFTLEQAQRAGVKNLDKYARNMLFARAMSNGVRWFCPDVFSGNAVYVPEELGAEVDGEGEIVDTTAHVVTPATAHIDDAPPVSQDGPEENPFHDDTAGAAAELKTAWRRLAKQWHPDHCSEPDAAEQFRSIQEAWEILGNDNKRARYNAGLALEATWKAQDGRNRDVAYMDTLYRSPLRCGLILVTSVQILGRHVVREIHQWADITNSQGETLVTSWPAGAKEFIEQWI